jgi:tungstate transport system substrate-binding protein
MLKIRCLTALVFICFFQQVVVAQDKFITLASTTSTQDSGLFKHLLPQFESKTGIAVRVVAQGTGQALGSGRRGDADVVLVHDKEAELRFVAEGFGVARHDVMYNDFILVGPRKDVAQAGAAKTISASLKAIAASKSLFISRGDKSGTHSAELKIWALAGINPAEGKGDWYREIGAGMGAALNMASASGAYTLSDRSTWLAFKNKGDLAIVFEKDTTLFNPYGVMLVNPAKHPHVKKVAAMQFIHWLTSKEGQLAIANFKISGDSVFFPSAVAKQSN